MAGRYRYVHTSRTYTSRVYLYMYLHTATLYNALQHTHQHTATAPWSLLLALLPLLPLQRSMMRPWLSLPLEVFLSTHSTTLQHTATHCNTRATTAAILEICNENGTQFAVGGYIYLRTAARCSTLQHIFYHCCCSGDLQWDHDQVCRCRVCLYLNLKHTYLNPTRRLDSKSMRYHVWSYTSNDKLSASHLSSSMSIMSAVYTYIDIHMQLYTHIYTYIYTYAISRDSRCRWSYI